MKNAACFTALIVVLGILGLAVNLIFIPGNVLPPNAPFKVEVTASVNVQKVDVSFNGVTRSSEKLPATFNFNAPALLNEKNETIALEIYVIDSNGKVNYLKRTVTVSLEATSEAVVKPLMKLTSNGAFSGNARFKISFYSGKNVEDLEWYTNNELYRNWHFSTLCPVSTTLNVEIGKDALKKGWNVFTLAERYSNGKRRIVWTNAYIFDDLPPIVNWNTIAYSPSSTKVTFDVTARSTWCAIKWVKINEKLARRNGKNTYILSLVSPKKSGNWDVRLETMDEAGNISKKEETIFVDGKTPSLEIRNNANYVSKGKLITMWKRIPPLYIDVNASSLSSKFGKTFFEVNGKQQCATSVGMKIEKSGFYSLNALVKDEINGLSVSTSLKFVVKFDDTPPKLEAVKLNTFYIQNARGYYVIAPASELLVTVKATDGNGAGIEKISVTPSSFGERNSPTFFLPNLEFGENDYPLRVTLQDMVGNSTTLERNLKIFVDNEYPSLQIKPIYSYEDNGIYWDPSEFEVKITSKTFGSVPPKLYIFVNGKKKFEVVSSHYTLKLKENGTYAVRIVSVDRVNGLKTEKTVKYTLKFDNSSPYIGTITAPATVGPNEEIKVCVPATDVGAGVKSVNINGKAAKFENGSYIAKIRTPQTEQSGEWKVTVKAEDNVGNTSTRSLKIFVDARPPKVKIKILPNEHFQKGIYWSKNIPFTVIVSGTTDGGVKPTLTTRFNGVLTPTNVYKIEKSTSVKVEITAVDPFNEKTACISKTYVFKFDRMPPVISHVSLSSSLVSPLSTLTVKMDVEDPGYGKVKCVEVNGIPATSNGKTWCATVTVPYYEQSGKFPVNIQAIDEFDNSSSRTFYTYVDAGKPEISLYLKTRGGTVKRITNGSILFFKSEPELYADVRSIGKPKWEIYLNGRKTHNGVLVNDTNTVKVTAMDTVNGKITNLSMKFCVVVDSQKPKVELKVPKVINVANDKVHIEAQDEYLQYALFTITRGKEELYSKLFTSSVATTLVVPCLIGNVNGELLNFEIKAVDMAGNVSFESAAASVDTVFPEVKSAVWKDKQLIITMSEAVEETATPMIVLVGKEKITGYGKLLKNGEVMIFALKRAPKLNETYKVEIENVKDECGNQVKETFIKIGK